MGEEKKVFEVRGDYEHWFDVREYNNLLRDNGEVADLRGLVTAADDAVLILSSGFYKKYASGKNGKDSIDKMLDRHVRALEKELNIPGTLGQMRLPFDSDSVRVPKGQMKIPYSEPANYDSKRV